MGRKSTTSEDIARPRRRGGRTAEVTRRVNQAVIELLIEGGLDACSFQRVAEKAGVERSTLYRRYPDRWGTIIDAIIDYAERQAPTYDTGSFRGDLTAVLQRVNVILYSPLGAPVMAVAATLQAGGSPGLEQRFWESRSKQLAPMFDRAVERGELAADVDREELFAIASGPFFFFAFVIGRRTPEGLIESVVDLVCERYCLGRG